MKKLIIASSLLCSTIIFAQNTGIGTTNPQARLDVHSDGVSFTNKALRITNANTEIVTVLEHGEVGINETSPQMPLHVSSVNGSSLLITPSADDATAAITFSRLSRLNSLSSALGDTWQIGHNINNTAGPGNFSISRSNGGNAMTFLKNGNIGIGTDSPSNTFDVNGQIRSETINTNTGSSTDKIVVADTNGVLKTIDRSTLGSAGWSLTGNAGTTPGTNFLGTTDNQDLIFKRNNVSAGILNAQNTALGAGSMKSLNLASNMFNTTVGNDSQLSLTSGNANTSIGFASLRNITTGSGNTAVGNMVMMSTLSGTDNVSIGKGAGNNSSTGGTGNILIGAGANKPFSTTGNNQLNIGDWIFGDNGKIGIGAVYKPTFSSVDNITPGKTMTEQLEVDGSAKLLKINSAAYVGSSTDKTVVADANGVLKTLPAKPANSVGTTTSFSTVNLNVSGDYAPIILKKEIANGFGDAAVEYKLQLVNNLWQVTFAIIGTGGNINYEIMWVSNR